MPRVLSTLMVAVFLAPLGAAEKRVPTVDDLLNLESIGFGHGITKPRARRAVLQHNLAWFNHYLWGDPKPDFAAPDVPKKKTETTPPLNR